MTTKACSSYLESSSAGTFLDSIEFDLESLSSGEHDWTGITATEVQLFLTDIQSPDSRHENQIPNSGSSTILPSTVPQNFFPFEEFDVLEENISQYESSLYPASDFDAYLDPLFTEASSSDEDGSLPPSPTKSSGFSDGSCHTTKIDVTIKTAKTDTRSSFQEWTFHDHMRPDGTCRCPESKKKGKCVTLRNKRKRANKLWNFLLELLRTPEYSQYIRWLDIQSGVFRIEQSQSVAQLWGRRKKKDKMTYEHMSRGLRHYYAAGILRRLPDKRLTYQFGPNAENWKLFAGLQNV